MATLAPQSLGAAGHSDERFFFKLACWMAAFMVTGFSFQFLAGRSTFAAPLRVHAHALVFFGWIVLFLIQANAAVRRDFALHRLLGRVSALWMAMMLTTGIIVTLGMVRGGTVPFFFRPQQFLVSDPVTIIGFIGLTLYAISKRRERDWHMRLQICALASIMGPGFGRLLPSPLFTPFAFEIAVLSGLIFPVIGMIHDRRVDGTVHPAWWRGVAAIIAVVAAFDLIAYSPLGASLYHAVVAGSPAEAVPGLAFGNPPA